MATDWQAVERAYDRLMAFVNGMLQAGPERALHWRYVKDEQIISRAIESAATEQRGRDKGPPTA